MTDKCPFCDAGRIGESRTFGCLTYCDENDGHLRSRECERRGHQKQIDALELELDSMRQLLADIPEYAGLSESESAQWEDKPHVLVRKLRMERDAAIAKLKEWVPLPELVSGWDCIDCPIEQCRLIAEACEIHGVRIPKHIQEGLDEEKGSE